MIVTGGRAGEQERWGRLAPVVILQTNRKAREAGKYAINTLEMLGSRGSTANICMWRESGLHGLGSPGCDMGNIKIAWEALITMTDPWSVCGAANGLTDPARTLDATIP